LHKEYLAYWHLFSIIIIFISPRSIIIIILISPRSIFTS
jgi:ketol-acid reductoisomerase